MSPDSKTYRGRSLEEILPRIREELGPDAVITRQRDGLAGGVAGFFQKQFVEVEAQAGHVPLPRRERSGGGAGEGVERPDRGTGEGRFARPRGRLIDTYDQAGTEVTDPALHEGMQSPAIRTLMEQAAPFAAALDAAATEPTPYEMDAEPAAEVLDETVEPIAPPEPPAASGLVPVPVSPRPEGAEQIEQILTEAGLSPALAGALVSSTVSHLLPFASERELKRLVRSALARRIPTQPGWGGMGRTLAFVGTAASGKTACTARMARAYDTGSDLPVICIALRPVDNGAELRGLLADTDVPVFVAHTAGAVRAQLQVSDPDVVVIIDTPSVSPEDTDAIDLLADELEQINPYEVHLTLPATTQTPAAREILAETEELGVSRIALTHVDSTRHVGAAVGLAMITGRPISYISSGSGVQGELEPADSYVLATMMLP